jgi:hypothetical protein
MPAGRPTKYSKELALEFCRRLQNSRTQNEVCQADDMPHRDTIHHWRRTIEDFSDMYIQARKAQAWNWVDNMMERAYDESRDILENEISYTTKDGSVKMRKERRSDNTAVNRDKLICDSIKFLIARFSPKDFGEKITQEVTGKDGEPFKPILNITIKK